MASSDCQESLILSTLRQKAEHEPSFRWVATLEGLADRIKPEMEYVSGLFPEYTPHTVPLHLFCGVRRYVALRTDVD